MATTVEQMLQNAQQLERSLKLDAEQLELADIRRGMADEGRKRIAEEADRGLLPMGDVVRAELNILQVEARTLESRATFLTRWSEFVAVTGADPVLNHLPARHGREKK
jgi:hypothetical protein